MDIQAAKGTTESPSLVLFNTEDRLRKKLVELELTMTGMRDILLGAQPQEGEEAKTADTPSGFFAQMQARLKTDIGIVDSITAYACEIRDSLPKA